LGPLEQKDEKSWYFLIERDNQRYDIGEMSSGEEAIFLLLLHSLRLQMVKSVILIDEPELHLNSKEQEWLMMNLEEIFPNCQIIMASHSPYIEEFFAEDEIVELKDGEVVE
jgi:predicted ATP-dependent endonuclease of OLD family